MDSKIQQATLGDARRIMGSADLINLRVEQARRTGCLDFETAREIGELADLLRSQTIHYLIRVARMEGIGAVSPVDGEFGRDSLHHKSTGGSYASE